MIFVYKTTTMMTMTMIMGHKISLQFGDDREASFLFQRLCVLTLRFSAVLLHDSYAQVRSPFTTFGLETEWNDSGRKARDGQKKQNR